MTRTARDILEEKGGHMITISHDATVYQAVKVMIQNRIGSLVVVDEGRIIGIWTERDLLYRILEEGFDPRTELVSAGMSRNLVSAEIDEKAYQLSDKFLGKRIRHLLIRHGGEYVGILSAGDVMRANLQQRAEDYRDLNEMVSFEYYENWKIRQQETAALR